MIKPLLDLSKDWQQPTSIREDQRFAGYPWKVFTPGDLVRGSRSDSTGFKYFKIPASLLEDANIVAIYQGGAMLLAHGQLPDDTRPASFKNPKTYNYYRWTPSLYYHDGKWLSLSDFVRAVMPDHQEPAADSPVARTREYWERRRKLAEDDLANAVRYICTCGCGYTQTIYRELGDKPDQHCPGGGIMRRVLDDGGNKYLCDCGKKHVRTVYPGRQETPPDQCPDDGVMAVDGGG
jgi:hypothetical protein